MPNGGDEANILASIQGGEFILDTSPPLAADLLERIVLSFRESDNVPLGVLRAMRAQRLFPE
jgi:hypothetical protein